MPPTSPEDHPPGGGHLPAAVCGARQALVSLPSPPRRRNPLRPIPRHRRQQQCDRPVGVLAAAGVGIIVLVVLLVTIGVIMVFSSSYARAYYKEGNSTYYFARQAIFAVLGIGVMLFVSRINYQLWRSVSFLVLAGTIFFLLLVPISVRRKAARSAGSGLALPRSSPRSWRRSQLF